MRFIDEVSLERLNIRDIINRIETLSSYGKEKVKLITPFKREEQQNLEKEFFIMSELKKIYTIKSEHFYKIENIIHKIKNIKNLVDNFSCGYILDDADFFELKIQGILMEELRKELEDFPEELSKFKLLDVKKFIDILDPHKDRMQTFYIYDSYSEKIASIRSEKRALEKKIYEEDDREKLQILKEKRLKYVIEEEAEELKIRKRLMEQLSSFLGEFRENINTIGEFDFTLGKVKFSLKYGGCIPKISQEHIVRGKGLVNLELKEVLRNDKKNIVPIDIELNSGSNLITGANMGGKSIALKTIAENLIMFHYGIFPIAEEATFPMVDFIFFVSDDMQDISKGLSTFGGEIIKLKEVSIFLNQGKGIVFFDEFARGTNPEEGKKFVKTLLKFLDTKESISLLTTHFDGVAEDNINHYQVVGLKNVDFEKLRKAMELKRNSLSLLQEFMDYKLERTKESEVPKYAFNIGVLLGMDKDFFKILKESYKEDY